MLLPVHPLPVATYRAAFTPSRAQDDPTAAERQGERLLKPRDKRKPLQPQRPALRALAPLVEPRRRLVGDTVRGPHRLPRALHNSFPQVLQCCPEKDTALFGDVLRRWPTLKAAPLARRSTLHGFFRAHPVRAAAVLAPRLPAINSASALPTDAGVILPHGLLGQARIAPLRVTWQAIADFDTAMAPRAQAHPAFPVLDAWPGAGAVLAPRLRVAVGEQRARGTAADALQKYAGIAPGTARSAKQSWVHWRLQCPPCLRHTFVEWAAESTRHACGAQGDDQQQRDKGKAQQAAGRAWACPWSRILYRCWQERRPYDESVYLQALKRRSAPLLHHLAHAS